MTSMVEIENGRVVRIVATSEPQRWAGWLPAPDGTALGMAYKDGVFFEKPFDESDFQRVKARIQVERDRRQQSGGYKVGDYWFHSDVESKTLYLGMALLGANLPQGTPWKTMSGEFAPMSPQLVGQILATAALSNIAVFNAGEAHVAAMTSAPNPYLYDFSTGWPPMFGDES